MLVILKENVENLGQIGDVVRVSAGYARNFIVPKRLGVVADESNIRMIENQKKILEKKRQAAKGALQSTAEKLQDFQVTIQKKVGENDKLFGSVGTAEIAEALKAAGHTVERRMIHSPNPIKTLGVHTVIVKFDADIQAEIKVWVAKDSKA